MRIVITTVIFLFILACKAPTDDLKHQQEIEDLQLKLNATEAQLLNVRAELSKCKGDETEQDSVNIADSIAQ